VWQTEGGSNPAGARQMPDCSGGVTGRVQCRRMRPLITGITAFGIIAKVDLVNGLMGRV